MQAIAARHELQPNQVSAWKRQLLDAVPEVFAKGGRGKLAKEHEAKIHDLHAKIGELTVERDFFGAGEALSRTERFGMIEPDGPLSLSRQCVLLGVSSVVALLRPKGERAENLAALMRRIDELHMTIRSTGARQMMRHLHREGVTAGRHRIRRLMRLMGRLSNTMDASFCIGALDDALDSSATRGQPAEAPASTDIVT